MSVGHALLIAYAACGVLGVLLEFGLWGEVYGRHYEEHCASDPLAQASPRLARALFYASAVAFMLPMWPLGLFRALQSYARHSSHDDDDA